MHLWRLRKVMIREDVLLHAAIRSDVTVKTPLSAGDRVEQPRIGAARYAVDCIVRAHQAGNVAFEHAWKGGMYESSRSCVEMCARRMARIARAVDRRSFHRVGDVMLAARRGEDVSGVVRRLEAASHEDE